MRHSLSLIPIAASTIMLLACSSSGTGSGADASTDSPASTGPDSGAAADAAADAAPADGGDLCAMIPQNNAPTITDSVSSSAYPGPQATGGALPSGTYFQTQHVYYQPTGTPNHTWAAVLVVDAAAGTIVSNVSRDGAVFQQIGYTFTTSGSALQLTIQCPANLKGTSVPESYTYANGTWTIFTDADKTGTVFQKQ